MEILTNLLYQLLFTVGLVAGCGLLIAILRKLFLKLSGTFGYYVLLIFGIVGTPIHELSHALMCLIFGHKVTEIKLFSPSSADGTLGYVNHTYNPRNIYHQIGNFFIGTAPVILGSGVIILLMYLLIPNVFSAVLNEFSVFDSSLSYKGYLSLLCGILGVIFSGENFINGSWWVFFLLAIMISSHMELSFLDVKGGTKGFLAIMLLLLSVDVLLYFTAPDALTYLTGLITSFAVPIVGFLGISLIFLSVMATVAFILKLIF